jgi:hypothetical protein
MLVEVMNATKGFRICRARVAGNFFSRALGLMFKKELAEDEGLLIEFSPSFSSRSIHSFFMRFPIDLVFISRDKRAVDLKTLEPWRVYSPSEECQWVLEVNKGAAKAVEIGDVIEFQGPG